MEELKNADKKGIGTKRKIGKSSYEVLIHFNEIQLKQCKINLQE